MAKHEALSKSKAGIVKRRPQERGVIRYNALLDAAHALLIEREVDDLGLYLIAERAGVPAGSAYYFFPTPAAVILALADRYHQQFQALIESITVPTDGRWQSLLRDHIVSSARTYNENPPMQKLFLGSHAIREVAQSEAGFNELMAKTVIASCESFFEMPPVRDALKKYLIALTLVDAIWSLSYAKNGSITTDYQEEAVMAAIAYCRTFLPEMLDRKVSE